MRNWGTEKSVTWQGHLASKWQSQDDGPASTWALIMSSFSSGLYLFTCLFPNKAMTSKAGSISCVSLCPQLWACSLAPSRHPGVYGPVSEQSKVIIGERLRGSLGKLPRFVFASRHLIASTILCLRTKKKWERQWEGSENRSYLGWTFSDTVSPLFHLLLCTCPEFSPLGLHSSHLPLSSQLQLPWGTCHISSKQSTRVFCPFLPATLIVNSWGNDLVFITSCPVSGRGPGSPKFPKPRFLNKRMLSHHQTWYRWAKKVQEESHFSSVGKWNKNKRCIPGPRNWESFRTCFSSFPLSLSLQLLSFGRWCM